MIICSCNVISDADIERVLVDLLNRPDAPVPTPGLVYRELQKRMDCCGCAPLAVTVIYQRLEALESKGLVCRFRCADMRSKLRIIVNRAARQPDEGLIREPDETSGFPDPAAAAM